MSDDYDDGWEDAMAEAFQLNPMDTAPKGCRVLITDGSRWFVAERMTVAEHGEHAWVYARSLGADAVAFTVPKPIGWVPLPEPTISVKPEPPA